MNAKNKFQKRSEGCPLENSCEKKCGHGYKNANSGRNNDQACDR